jgi:hypothetical protein
MKRFLPVVLLVIVFSGCSKKDVVGNVLISLDYFSSQYAILADSCRLSGLVSIHQYDEMIQVSKAALEASGKIRSVIKDLEALTPEARKDIYNILAVMSWHLEPERFAFIDDIGDEKIRKRIDVSLLTIRAVVISTGFYLIYAR